MGEAEQNRRNKDSQPCAHSGLRKGGHSESAIKKFFAKPGGDGQCEIGRHLDGGLRKDAFGDGLQRTARLRRNAADAAQVEPLQGGNYSGADNSGDQ